MLTVSFDTDLGLLSWEVHIKADRKNLLFAETGECMTPLIKQLLGDHYEGNPELQEFTAGLIYGATACFFALAEALAGICYCSDEEITEESLSEFQGDDIKIGLQAGCRYLRQRLEEELQKMS